MSSLQTAIDSVAGRKLAYWKLYKGTIRISQCDADENPDSAPAEALRQFEEEVNNRPPGNYTVCVYRKLNGEKGGFKYDFTISGDGQRHSPQRTGFMSGMTPSEIYAQAERDIKILQYLERLEKKVDAIGEFIYARSDGDEGNDDKAFKIFAQLFGNAMKAKAAAGSGANGFKGLSL